MKSVYLSTLCRYKYVIESWSIVELSAITLNHVSDKSNISRTTKAVMIEPCLICMKNLAVSPLERNSITHSASAGQLTQRTGLVRRRWSKSSQNNVRAATGKRAIRTVNSQQGPNFTICFAVSNQRDSFITSHHTSMQIHQLPGRLVHFCCGYSRNLQFMTTPDHIDNPQTVSHLTNLPLLLNCVQHMPSVDSNQT